MEALEVAGRMREMVEELRELVGELGIGYAGLQVHHGAAYLEWRAGRIEQEALGVALGDWQDGAG